MKTIFKFAAIISLLFSAPAMAIEPISADELKSYCDHYIDDKNSPKSETCVAYVNGFLDGAVTTDERVTRNVVEEFEKEETFSERATRTRVFQNLRRYGPSVYAKFCVGEPVPISEVVTLVVEELNARTSLETAAARNIVYAVLSEHYPCQPQS